MYLYDRLSVDYDRFVNWERRLAVELPFIEQQLERVGARCVLDVACGTGQHAVALAQRGYQLVGVDVSAAMIAQAQQNAQAAGVQVLFAVAGFGELATRQFSPFDALLCLGSSLPHIASPDELFSTLHDMAAVLRPGGLLIVQNRNFDLVLTHADRWMPPQAHREEESEWLFLRFYDFNPDGSLTFNVLTLQRQNGQDWQQHVASTRLWPLQQDQVVSALQIAGFDLIQCYGDMQEKPFQPATSPNLIVVARRGKPG